MNKTIFIALILVFLLSACSATSAPISQPVSNVGVPEVKTGDLPIIQEPAKSGTCPTMEAKQFPVAASLSEVVKNATGAYPAMVNSCFAIFNNKHGNRTNWLFVKNGWALLNLPVEVFTPWMGDTFIVGDPKSVASQVTIDEDTIIVDGGVTNTMQGNEVIAMVDWSTVKGGIFVNALRFESDRAKVDANNNRYWTAYCNGKTFDNSSLEAAYRCGLGE